MQDKFENKEVAIKVENVSKVFKIPHEKVDTIRGAFVSAFKKTTYEEFKALDDVSFEVRKGEFFGIIGRNGSGKSTLLKILAGIYQADKGKVEINGRISPFLELGIGFNPELSGRDNIYLNGTVLGLTKKQINEKFDDIVRFSELKKFIDQKLKNYSSGMQVRLAFSVAVHANRDILLLDEVLAVGDSNFQRKCLDISKAIKNSGKTVVFVSHDTEKIRKFCDRVLLIDDSKKVIIAGPERAIYEYNQLLLEHEKKFGGYNKEKVESKKPVNKKNDKKTNSILKVELFNEEGKRTNVFESCERIIVCINIEIKKIEKDMFLGLGLFERESNIMICRNSMYYEGLNRKWSLGINKVKLVLEGDYLNRGDFYIISSFFKGDPGGNSMYDVYNGKEIDEYFRIIPLKEYYALTQVPHKWN